MSYYNIEQWSVRDVAKAFKEVSGDSSSRKVSIPIFQRGLRWEPDRRAAFIDSLSKGYPFGSLLFANNGNKIYSVIDGLQRGSTVCDYVFSPLDRHNMPDIDDDILTEIRKSLFPGNENHSVNGKIKELILDFVDEKKSFNNITVFDIAKYILKNIKTTEDKFECVDKITEALTPFFNKLEEDYDDICSAPVPIVVYTGPNELMSDIFNRINKQGISLNDYEIYAAIWNQRKYKINCSEVVKRVVDKYLVLTKKGYNLEGFNSQSMLSNEELTAFEFIFGLGKYWPEQYSCLKVSSKKEDSDVNEISFEIMDACLSSSKDIANLDKNISKYNINKLQRRIEEAIKFVSAEIAVVGSFKGNKRKLTVLHSKYQIISLIAYTFRKMYSLNDLEHKRVDWDENVAKYKKNLLAHYVADIISNEWHDGGGNKVYTSIREKRYDEDISLERWNMLLDSYYQHQLTNKQASHFSSPTNSDSIILNCIYANIFTAGDQLSSKKFDIEHLAPKDKMRNLMKTLEGVSLPVSCIANLCYLPEDINRGKRDKTLYEATKLSLSIDEIETKFSFTKETDFNWIYKDYPQSKASELVKEYGKFLDCRFKKMKEIFLKMFTED